MTTLATIGVLIAAVGGMIGGIAALVAAIVAWRTRGDVHSVHLQLNSRFDEWQKEQAETLEIVAKAKHAEGVLAGKAAAKAEEKS